MMKRSLLAIAALGVVAVVSCRHHPVYPDYATLFITSSPSGAEVIVDGALTRRTTPLKLDGIAAGGHEVRLRYFGYRVSRSWVTIEGGMTKRMSVRMVPILPRCVARFSVPKNARSMAFEPISGRVYVATNSLSLTVAQFRDSSLTPLAPIPLQIQTPYLYYPGQKLVAVSSPASRIYTVLNMKDSILAVDLSTGAIRKRFKIGMVDSTKLVQIRFSDDGRHVYLADSLNHRIWVVDASNDSVTGYLPVPGTPGDFLYDSSSRMLYVAITNTRQICEIDAAGGAVVRSVATGTNPGGLFPDNRGEQIGYCVHPNKRPVILDLGTWSPANGPVINNDNDLLIGGVFASDRTHLWVVSSSTPYPNPNAGHDGLVCIPGWLNLIYLPSQLYVTHYELSKHPVAVVQTLDGRYLLVLHGADPSLRPTNNIEIFRTDTD